MANAKRLPSGSWRVQIFVGMENGKRKYKSFTAVTRREAEYQAAKYAATKVEVCRSELTLSDAVKRYIESKQNILSPNTINGYNTIYNFYLDEIGDMKIKDITQEHVQRQINSIALNYSSKTCRNAHGLISAVLKNYKPEMILRTTLPAKRKRGIYVPDEKEIKKILELTKGTQVYIPFLLATQCGLRASEISGLDLKNVHEDYIEIKHATVRGLNGKVKKQPKSISGYRKIPIDKALYDILVENSEGENVCSCDYDYISHSWTNFRRKHNLNENLTFYALRHHFCSRCLILGIPQKYIAELMGHRDTTMIEQVYQHTFPSAMAGYANTLRQNGNKIITAAGCIEKSDEKPKPKPNGKIECNTRCSTESKKPHKKAG